MGHTHIHTQRHTQPLTSHTPSMMMDVWESSAHIGAIELQINEPTIRCAPKLSSNPVCPKPSLYHPRTPTRNHTHTHTVPTRAIYVHIGALVSAAMCLGGISNLILPHPFPNSDTSCIGCEGPPPCCNRNEHRKICSAPERGSCFRIFGVPSEHRTEL